MQATCIEMHYNGPIEKPYIGEEYQTQDWNFCDATIYVAAIDLNFSIGRFIFCETCRTILKCVN